MLLVCAADRVARHRVTVRVADLSIAEIIRLTLRAAIAAHGHPAGIDDCPTLFTLMADDGRQHAQRDVR